MAHGTPPVCSILILVCLSGFNLQAQVPLESVSLSYAGSSPDSGDVNRFSKNKDSFFASDKVQHFMVSLMSTVFFSKLLQKAGNEKSDARIAGGGISFALGLGKEFRDSTRKNNHFSWKDLAADVAGIAIGLVLVNQP